MTDVNNNLGDRESDFELPQGGEMVTFNPETKLMGKLGIREIDGQQQRIFFYHNIKNKRTIAFTEAEAALMMKSSHAPFLEQVGCSDGRTHDRYIASQGLKKGDRITKERAEKILKEAWEAEQEAARGHFGTPIDNNVHFGGNFPMNQRQSFNPPL